MKFLTHAATTCLAVLLIAVASAMLPVNSSGQQLFEQRATGANEVELFTTNYGVTGLNVSGTAAGGFWPRSSAQPGAYMFGAGLWFGTISDEDGTPVKRIFKTYNPNSGNSWAAPGDVSDGPAMQSDAASVSKYRIYSSVDYGADGQPLSGDAPGWPMWSNGQGEVGSKTGNLGTYVSNVNDRNMEVMSAGPAFVSDEDLICRFKDSDVNLYEGGAANANPIGLQFEQAIYSWADSDHENFVLLRYDVTNVSGEDLHDCFIGHAGDFDIGNPAVSSVRSAGNDRITYFEQLSGRQMVVLWSENDADVQGMDYGYFGVAMMQSPTLDDDGFVIQGADPTDYQAQIGLTSVRNWVIQNDPTDAEESYDFMSGNLFDSQSDAGDKRLMFSSGGFNLRAGETARFVFGFFFAPSASGIPNGLLTDVELLVDEVDKGHELWSGRVVSTVGHSTTADFGLSLSPNPARDQLNIAFNSATPGAPATIDILDQTGRIVLTQRVRTAAQKESVAFVLDDLAAGSYFCRLSTGDGHQTAGFVVVR